MTPHPKSFLATLPSLIDERGADARDLLVLRERMDALSDLRAKDATKEVAARQTERDIHAADIALAAALDEEARAIERNNETRMIKALMFDTALALGTYLLITLLLNGFRESAGKP